MGFVGLPYQFGNLCAKENEMCSLWSFQKLQMKRQGISFLINFGRVYSSVVHTGKDIMTLECKLLNIT